MSWNNLNEHEKNIHEENIDESLGTFCARNVINIGFRRRYYQAQRGEAL